MYEEQQGARLPGPGDETGAEPFVPAQRVGEVLSVIPSPRVSPENGRR
jgi:hypothetical protein